MYSVDDPSHPIPEKIRYVSDGFRVRHEIPTSGRVLIIIQPTAEDEVRGDAHECTVDDVSFNHETDECSTYMIMNHVKKPNAASVLPIQESV